MVPSTYFHSTQFLDDGAVALPMDTTRGTLPASKNNGQNWTVLYPVQLFPDFPGFEVMDAKQCWKSQRNKGLLKLPWRLS
jgi:hypothetical protein